MPVAAGVDPQRAGRQQSPSFEFFECDHLKMSSRHARPFRNPCARFAGRGTGIATSSVSPVRTGESELKQESSKEVKMFRFRHFAAPAVIGTALFLGGGCAHERHDDIPLSATEIGEGKESVFFNAPYDGRVYVYDATSDDMLYNGELRRGQMVKVDAKDNKILVDNQTAVERDLVNDHRFKIFFDKDENAATASQVIVPPSNNTTIVTPAAPAGPAAAPAQTYDPNAPRTTIQVQPAPAAPAPSSSEPRTTIQVQPAPSDAAPKTTVTTPDAKITTDPNSGRTTVQPR
jgi:hypothetical protein